MTPVRTWEFKRDRPVADEAPPDEAPRAVAVSPAGRVVRWTRWRDETGAEFADRVAAEAARLGLVRVRFIAGRD